MNCQEFNQHIDDFIANGLEVGLDESVRLHIEGCTACRQRVENRLQLKKSLHDLPVPAMREGFADQVIQTAIRANTPDRNSHSLPRYRWVFGAGFATALAASFAVWFFVNTFTFTKNDFQGNSIQALNIELHELKTVKILFDSPQAMDHAVVSLELPDNIELEGYSNQRALTWSTRLKAGKNVLSLPVRARDLGNGELVTKVEFGGKSKLIRFNVNVNRIHQSAPIDNVDMPLAGNRNSA